MLPSGKPAPLARRAFALLPLGWAALVLALTLLPAKDLPVTPVWKLVSFDTAAHAGVFFVLAGLSWFSLRRQRRWPSLAHRAGLAALGGSLLFGGLIEVLQHAMGLGRHGDWTDLLSDAIGAALAVGVATALAARRPRGLTPLVSFGFGGMLFGAVALSAAPAPARAQDVSRARRTIEQLAAPAMHGRGYVRQGERKAAAYLRGRLRELRLEPLAPDYTQPFTLDVNTFPGEMRARFFIEGSSARSAELTAGRAFIAAPNSGSGAAGGPVQLLDSTIFSDTLAWAGWRRQPLQGKVLWMRQAVAKRLPELPIVLQQRFDSAAAWVTVVPKLTASLASYQARQPRIEVLATEVPAWSVVRPGQPAALTAENGRAWVDVRVDAQLRRNYPTQNLAAIVRGTAQPDSFLVVAAHYDHLGTMGAKTYFPGANDNASGVALLLELAAHYARPENRPACSVVFLLFGAEEAGLVGSRYFVAHPLVPLARIRFLVNLDLLGTGEQGATVVNGRVPALEPAYRRLVALNAAHHYLPQLAPRGPAANSDHFPFSEAGVPAFFLYTRGGSPAYHDVNDRPAALSLAGFAGAFGLVRDFLNGLGAAKK